MSNITPQHRDLNRGLWLQLETFSRKILSQADSVNAAIHDLYVITGPIFNDSPLTLPSGVAIPTHSYKIFAYKEGYFGTVKAVAFVLPQHPDSGDIMDYVRSVDEIESLTSLNFFSALSESKQRNLESVIRNFELEEIEN